MEAETIKQPVHDKGHTGHIPTIFQNGNEAEQDKKNRDIVQQGIDRVHYPQGKGSDHGDIYKSRIRHDPSSDIPQLGQKGPGVIGQVIALDNG